MNYSVQAATFVNIFTSSVPTVFLSRCTRSIRESDESGDYEKARQGDSELKRGTSDRKCSKFDQLLPGGVF